MWVGKFDYNDPVELAIRQTLGVALKSRKGADYIEQLMTLDPESQEHLGAIVKTCLSAIDDRCSSKSSSRSIDFSQRSSIMLSERVFNTSTENMPAVAGEMSLDDVEIESKIKQIPHDSNMLLLKRRKTEDEHFDGFDSNNRIMGRKFKSLQKQMLMLEEENRVLQQKSRCAEENLS